MNSVKILHCADIHIGAAESFLGARADSRRYETVLTFERIIDTAVSAGADVFAIAGDLIDKNTSDARVYRPQKEKIALCDVVLYNNADEEALRNEVLSCVKRAGERNDENGGQL